MIEWTGVLALLNTPSFDGCALARPERLNTRPLPLPLIGEDGKPVGAITNLSIHADQLRAEGTLADGTLPPGRPLPVALDADENTYEAWEHGVLFTSWRVLGATLLHPDDTPPWPQALIRAKETTP